MPKRKHDPVADFTQWPEPNDFEGWAKMFYDDCDHLPTEMTKYDWMTLPTYLAIIDDDAEGVHWRDGVRLRLARDPAIDEASAQACWESHLSRAQWVCEVGIYLDFDVTGIISKGEIAPSRKLH